MKTKIITWLWSQPNARFVYTADHVNAWYRAIRSHGCTIPVAVITDQTDGIDPEIEIIKPPTDFLAVKCAQWDEKAGLPQCYRRLAIYAPDASQWLGCDKILQMDIDCIITGDLTPLFDISPDIALFRGTSAKRPYNGGMQLLRLGARTEVYTDFNEANAKIASSRFVGSDQAWIAHKLGWGETKITGEHGVYHYSGQFLRLYPHGRPENMRVLFCPGPKKFLCDGSFWNADDDMKLKIKRYLEQIQTEPHGVQDDMEYIAVRNFYNKNGLIRKGDIIKNPTNSQIKLKLVKPIHREIPADSREKKIIQPDETKSNRILALRDKKNWAALAAKYANAQIIDSIEQVKSGDAVMVRMRCNGPEKAETLEAVKALHERGIKTLPTMQEALWYDDKIAQYEALKKWMPQTWIFTTRKEAVNFSESATFPLIRKLAHGASSCNVSLIKNKSALKKSIADAFRRNGDGYIYLQEYIKTDCDYRINISGRYLYGITRYIRSEDQPFASGSGLNSVMYFTDPLERKAALLAVEIAREIGTQWACFDFVWDGAEMRVLEMSSAWRADCYDDCPLHYHDLYPSGKRGSEYFEEVGRLCQ